MPELPDVEAFRRHLSAGSLQRPIARVEVVDPYLLRDTSRQRLGRALKRTTLVGTRRHGKHLFAETSGGGWLVLHFGMTGFLRHCAEDAPRPEHTRFVLHFDDGSLLAFADQRKLGFVSYTTDADEFLRARDLGPDALRLSYAELRDLLRARRGALKSALMDQSLISGIGNIYSDEILFQARLAPKRGAADLDAGEYRRLHRQLRRVLQLAADRGADPDRLPDSWLLLHREDGAPCPRSNGHVRKFTMSGRGAFHCPACQPG